jgi:hypothetical protein
MKMISELISINGMYEVHSEHEHVPMDTSVNPDLMTWKKYPVTLREN